MGSASLETRTLRDHLQTLKTIQARKNNHQNITSSECKATSKASFQKKQRLMRQKFLMLQLDSPDTSKNSLCHTLPGNCPTIPPFKKGPFFESLQ